MRKISFIVPIFNVERYIKVCVESIQSQTYENIEIILINDGSQDKCGEIIDEISQNDSRIKVIHQVNKGVSSARNAGLKVATGDYILFVDGDDYVDPDYATSFVNLIERYNTPMAFSYSFACDNYAPKIKQDRTGIISAQVACEQLYLDKIGVAVWNKIYQREFLEINNLLFNPDYWFAEGMTFNIECFMRCESIAVMDQSVYHQRTNPLSAVRKFNLESWKCGRKAMEYQRHLIQGMNKNVIDAWNYHYRQYNYSILCGIIKSRSEQQYSEEINKCIDGLRHNLTYPLIVNISLKGKVKCILSSIMPIAMAKRDVKRIIQQEMHLSN